MSNSANYSFMVSGKEADVDALQAYTEDSNNMVYEWSWHPPIVFGGEEPEPEVVDGIRTFGMIVSAEERQRCFAYKDGIFMELVNKFPDVEFGEVRYTDDYGSGYLSPKVDGFKKLNTRLQELSYSDGRSDKIYNAWIEPDEADLNGTVHFEYGRRGNKLTQGTKTKGPVPIGEAEKILEKLVKSKERKGYH